LVQETRNDELRAYVMQMLCELAALAEKANDPVLAERMRNLALGQPTSDLGVDPQTRRGLAS
jgi:hypothetical protein